MFLKNPMDDILHYCLTTPKDSRDKAINEALCHFFQSFPYFRSLLSTHKTYGHVMYISIIKSLNFKSYKPKDIIVKENDTVNAMIFLITGTTITYKSIRALRRTSNIHNTRTSSIQFEIEHLNTQGSVLSPLEITKTKKHPHRIQAKTHCITAELPITEYTLIFEKTQFLEKASLITFIENLRIFNSFAQSSNYINEFIDVVNKKRYNKNNIVVHKGDALKSLFIIRQGMFQIIFTTSKRYLNTIDLRCFRSDEEERHERFTSERVHEFKDSYNEVIKYKLLNLTEGDMFGLIENHLGKKTYVFDLVCKADESEIIEVDLKYFNYEIKKYLLQSFEDKVIHQMHFLQNRIKQIKHIEKKKGNRNKYILAILNKIDTHNINKGIKPTYEMISKTEEDKNKSIIHNIYKAVSPKYISRKKNNNNKNIKKFTIKEISYTSPKRVVKRIPFLWETEKTFRDGDYSNNCSNEYNKSFSVKYMRKKNSDNSFRQCRLFTMKSYMNKDYNVMSDKRGNVSCSGDGRISAVNRLYKRKGSDDNEEMMFEVNKKFFLRTNTSMLIKNNKKVTFICPTMN